MTSQQIADQSLALYQRTRQEPRAVAEAMLEQFFRFASAADYEEQLKAVARQMEFSR